MTVKYTNKIKSCSIILIPVFFQMPLKINKYGTNIISTTTSHGKIHQDFFKVHRNHNILSQIKIRVTDENNIDFRSVLAAKPSHMQRPTDQPSNIRCFLFHLRFPRNTVVNLALCFRPAPLSIDD